MRQFDSNIKKGLQRYYEIKRSEAERNHALYLVDLYQKYPELKDLEIKRANLNLKKIKASITQSEGDYQDYSKKIEKIDLKLADYLRDHHIPQDYESVQYTCPICQDTGWAKQTYCRCVDQALAETNQINNPYSPAEDMTFSNFDVSIFSEEKDGAFYQGKVSPAQAIKATRNMLKDFVDNFSENTRSQNFYLFGSPGTGKTYLMACVANALKGKGFHVIFLKATQLFEVMAKRRLLLNSFRPDPEEQDVNRRDIEFIEKAELLCIDDLGLEANGLINAYADFIGLLDKRKEAGLSTIITSNLKPKDLTKQYDLRLGSRIAGDYNLIYIEGQDVRKEIANKDTWKKLKVNHED